MTSYEVQIQPRAYRDLDWAYRYLESRYGGNVAVDWYNGFIESLQQLHHTPFRFSYARENKEVENEIRQLYCPPMKLPVKIVKS